jgi:hypothetical protein
VLKDVHDSGAHLDDAKFVNCFSPDLLSAFDAQPPHMRWFAEEMARRAPGGVLQWAKSEASRYPQSLGPTMDQGAPETAAALIDALCASPDKRTQEAGLRLLAAVPEGARASVIDRVPSAWGLAWSPEKDIADRARGLLDQMNPAAKDFYIANTTK